jgi:predicted dehydrogenase
VLCPLPAALTHGEWDEIEAAQAATGAPLLTPTDLSCTIAGREALTRVQSGQLGALHAIYCAARSLRPAHPAADVLTQLGWEVLDFVLACTEAQPVRVYAAAGQLFGGGAPDAVLITLRFADGMIATVEVAQSLPEDFAGPSPEVEIDITGTTGALRVEPYRPAVAVHAGERASSRAWQTPPVAAMLSRLQRALEEDPAEAALLRRNRTLLTVMAAIRQSLAQGNAVEVAR